MSRAAVRALWWEMRQPAGWARPGLEAQPLKKESYVLPPACARGSKTGKWPELLYMKTAASLSLFFFFPPQLHFIIQLLDALAASWRELSIVHC